MYGGKRRILQNLNSVYLQSDRLPTTYQWIMTGCYIFVAMLRGYYTR